MTLVAQLSDSKKEFSSMLKIFSSILRDVMILLAKTSVADANDCAKTLSEKLSMKQVLNLIDIIHCTKDYVEKNVNLSNVTTFFCSNLFKISNRNL